MRTNPWMSQASPDAANHGAAAAPAAQYDAVGGDVDAVVEFHAIGTHRVAPGARPCNVTPRRRSVAFAGALASAGGYASMRRHTKWSAGAARSRARAAGTASRAAISTPPSPPTTTMARTEPRTCGRQRLVPGGEESRNRLDGDRVPGRAFGTATGGIGPDIERHDVEGDRRCRSQRRAAAARGRARRRDRRRSARRRHRPMAASAMCDVARAYNARDEAREHAGIGGERRRRNQRTLDARNGREREPSQHLDMRVPAADEQESARRLCAVAPYATLTPSIIPPSSCSRLWQWNR